MTVHQLRCTGPHLTPGPVLAVTELPDTRPAPTAHGLLCADCGEVYRVAVASHRHTPGHPPPTDLVCELLPGRRPAGWEPANPPPPPSWAPDSRPWPYPARPAPPD